MEREIGGQYWSGRMNFQGGDSVRLLLEHTPPIKPWHEGTQQSQAASEPRKWEINSGISRKAVHKAHSITNQKYSVLLAHYPSQDNEIHLVVCKIRPQPNQDQWMLWSRTGHDHASDSVILRTFQRLFYCSRQSLYQLTERHRRPPDNRRLLWLTRRSVV